MILEELHLQNFCLYRGLHRFALAPAHSNGRNSPITLFGGMNGAGKTTILDAVQLALYGSRARSASRIGKPYDDYLRESIHRGADPSEGASVSIRFRYHADGEEHIYEVSRGWSGRDKALREKVRVLKDDIPDAFLSENWNDAVEDLIPIGVSQLFFFDAEKVRFLADDETDTAALGTAIKSLLGLDMAERLITDAAIVERRLQEAILSHEDSDTLSKLRKQLEAVSAELSAAKAERASLENQLLRARRSADKARNTFATGGGEHWRKRSDLEAQLKSTTDAIKSIEAELRELSAGDLPMLLLSDLSKFLRDRLSEQERRARTAMLCDLVKIRDQRVLRLCKDAKMPQNAISSLKKVLEADLKETAADVSITTSIDISGVSRTALEQYVNGGFDEMRLRVRKIATRLRTLQRKQDTLQRQVGSVPQDDVIAPLVEAIQTTAAALGALEGNAKRLDDRIDSIRRERDSLDSKLVGHSQSAVKRTIEQDELLRLMRLAQRTQTTMQDFLHRATANKIERLSELVTRSFQFLLRKKTLVSHVRIHPELFNIELIDSRGGQIPKSRLSEGEKQIFAIALLWGLAQASPRQLPCIIDTPMARLDSEHRVHLVQRYFPNASHQVIVLSTDTEIEREYFDVLAPNIARSFHLRYNEDEHCTAVDEGYFWTEPAEIAQ